MNKLEQDTLEIIQEYLPRIAKALEKIADKTTNNKEDKLCKFCNGKILKKNY